MTWMLKQVKGVSIFHYPWKTSVLHLLWMSLLKCLEQNQTFLNSVLVEVGGMYEEGEGEVGEYSKSKA